MTSPLLNQPAPDFTREAHDGQQVRLADYRGKSVVVLYFYPKDGTPVCTKEACAFRDAYEEFTKLGAVVIGVSADSPERHRAFASDRALPFLLLSDHDGSLRRAYQVPKTLGIMPSRVTYVIDKAGVVRHVFSALLLADRHVADALEIVRELVRESEDQSNPQLPWRADSRGLRVGVAGNIGPISRFAVERLTQRGVPVNGRHRDPIQLSLPDLAAADLVIALKEAEHRTMLRELFPLWTSLVEYWHIDDLDCAQPEDALFALDGQVRALVERLGANTETLKTVRELE